MKGTTRFILRKILETGVPNLKNMLFPIKLLPFPFSLFSGVGIHERTAILSRFCWMIR